ncbi:MAG: c-type cytochrome [Candidatus Marinarcus sp.]|uniref:c-type cytochrome n=1 Tax=Candidatus Marinarcus sp. TaxID=3100987 RepID=UPI003B0026E7
MFSKILLITLFSPFLYASSIIDNSFITRYEYGQMLYENPRGIGCNKCHGLKGEGALIAKYKTSKGVEKRLSAPQISKVSWQRFKEVLSAKENKSLVMPTYFLTNEELVSIHYYITNLKK